MLRVESATGADIRECRCWESGEVSRKVENVLNSGRRHCVVNGTG